MKKILLHDPGISTMNLGDKIISKSAKNELNMILGKSFAIEISTHLPKSYYYMRHFKNFDYKFVLGSNLLKSTFFGFKRQWDITWRLSKYTGPSILMGVGWWQYGNKPNFYTKLLLKSLLSSEYLHSVRDDYTSRMLKKIGINNVINTSCPTMWNLTKDHCKQIKKNKSDKVVFTLTNYNKDMQKDLKLVKILKKNYREIYFWPQGLLDYEYLTELNVNIDNVMILDPSIKAFDGVLNEENIDYVGTRLHGGIRSLQYKNRTIIISIDNRAKEKSRSFNIPIIERNNIDTLYSLINSSIITDINIPISNIKKWKNQF
ncbi:polysaccharide pyruvyl transferase family protein [Halanaerobium congolense]|uniref:polysaccharide pyruvyl transferase family protein n=1 Tax=Halanaerobium congolense TaxID=54121 RepID=UPI00088581A8|nr:polysaccharide pyruvyl transferase family protein [Halanaerobium congolense]SDK97122.1 Polysaccharide pyruvyl transferase [Halanaerobium congolense]SDM95331.1 Polysaccharide pyruvyl transferase [Halanaerobium congolense]